ncbi:MAG: hypothetical protein P4N60_09800 [Verrucomicrobiae bacterium]|nr:hypothetical protein [Verrucomicrobiae bacterium]
MSIAVLAVLAVVAAPRIAFYRLTGRFTPIHKIETLHAPVAVKGWTPDGLSLADGRTVSLPGIHALPAVSPALSELTKRGVELSADGRVYGLVLVHHWCGNDPVREDISRVDISDALMFLHIGQTAAPVPESGTTARAAGGRFTEWGWNISEYVQFIGWQSLKGSVR